MDLELHNILQEYQEEEQYTDSDNELADLTQEELGEIMECIGTNRDYLSNFWFCWTLIKATTNPMKQVPLMFPLEIHIATEIGWYLTAQDTINNNCSSLYTAA